MAKIEIIAKIPKNIGLDKLKLSQIINHSLNQLGANNDMIVELGFVSRQKMANLNFKSRGFVESTDILSFPQKTFNQLSEQIFGSIIICPEVVESKRETMIDVLKHGILHLLNYDHENDQQSWNRAAKIINCRV